MKALVIADRNPTINLIETVKNENINLLISILSSTLSDILEKEIYTF